MNPCVGCLCIGSVELAIDARDRAVGREGPHVPFAVIETRRI
jgi:hypothetical protein